MKTVTTMDIECMEIATEQVERKRGHKSGKRNKRDNRGKEKNAGAHTAALQQTIIQATPIW